MPVTVGTDASVELPPTTGTVPNVNRLTRHASLGDLRDADGEAGVDRRFMPCEVLQHEAAYLDSRVAKEKGDSLAGLSVAVSGGGLRAASQGLGVMLLLKQLGMLHCVDYWSSVSGGGYTSTGWLTQILAQRNHPTDEPPQTQEEHEKVLAAGVDNMIDQLQNGSETNCYCECSRVKTAPYTRWPFLALTTGTLFGVQFYVYLQLALCLYFTRDVALPWAFYRNGSPLESLCAMVRADAKTTQAIVTYGCWMMGVDHWRGSSSLTGVQLNDVTGQDCFYSNVPMTHAWINIAMILFLIFFCHGCQYKIFSGGVWDSFPMTQRTMISVCHGLKGGAGVCLVMFSLMLLIVADFNSISYTQATGKDVFLNLPVGRVTGVVIMCLALATMQEVIGALKQGGHAKINAVLLIYKTAVLYFIMWTASIMQFNGLSSHPEHRYVSNEWTHWNTGIVMAMLLVVATHPIQRGIQGALGFVQQYYLRRMFYANRRDIPLNSINDPDWPVAPVYISNATQHDLTNARDYTSGSHPDSFCHFEMTSHHWGSYASGFWRTPGELRLSTAMEMSGAATSGSIGSALPADESGAYKSPWGGVVTDTMVAIGAETGRHHVLRDWGNAKIRQLKCLHNMCHVSMERIPELFFTAGLSVLLLLHFNAQSGIAAAIFEGIPAQAQIHYFINGSAEFIEHPFVGTAYAVSVANYTLADLPKCQIVAGGYVCSAFWTRFLSRYDDTDQIICRSDSFNNCDTSALVSLQNKTWWSQLTSHPMAWPVGEVPDRAIITKEQCVTGWTYQELWANIKAMEGCSTSCCYVSNLAWSLRLGMYECNGVHRISYYLLLYVALAALLIFLAPAFPRIRMFRWVLWSPFIMAFFRFFHFNIVVGYGNEEDVPMVFLADGGHCDNSAVLPLLRRKRKTIIAVDAAPDRALESIRELIHVTSKQLHCSWRPPMGEGNNVDDLKQYLDDFRLPRARYTPSDDMLSSFGDGVSLYSQVITILSRCTPTVSVTDIHLEERDALDETAWHRLPERISQLISHVRQKGEHMYIYFRNDETACTALAMYPAIRSCFSLCQAVTDATGNGSLSDADFLPLFDARSQLRNSLHLVCRYNDNSLANVYFLLPELTHQDRRKIRAELAPHENWGLSMQTFTLGLFPSHITGAGEGYAWEHINAYSQLSRFAAQQVFGADEGSPVVPGGASPEMIREKSEGFGTTTEERGIRSRFSTAPTETARGSSGERVAVGEGTLESTIRL